MTSARRLIAALRFVRYLQRWWRQFFPSGIYRASIYSFKMARDGQQPWLRFFSREASQETVELPRNHGQIQSKRETGLPDEFFLPRAKRHRSAYKQKADQNVSLNDDERGGQPYLGLAKELRAAIQSELLEHTLEYNKQLALRDDAIGLLVQHARKTSKVTSDLDQRYKQMEVSLTSLSTDVRQMREIIMNLAQSRSEEISYYSRIQDQFKLMEDRVERHRLRLHQMMNKNL